MARCGYINPKASGLIDNAIVDCLLDVDAREIGRDERPITEWAVDLTAEIKRILDVECDIEWVD